MTTILSRHSMIWFVLPLSALTIVHLSVFTFSLPGLPGSFIVLQPADVRMFVLPLVAFTVHLYFGLRASERFIGTAMLSGLVYTALFFSIIQPSRDYTLMYPAVIQIAVGLATSAFSAAGAWVGSHIPLRSDTPPPSGDGH